MPLNDFIDIGLFTGKKITGTVLHSKKEKLPRQKQTFEILLDQMPARAGIDPQNKLIDRVADDNMIDVISVTPSDTMTKQHCCVMPFC